MVGEGEHRHGSQCFGVLNKDAHQEHRDGVGEVWSETAKSMAEKIKKKKRAWQIMFQTLLFMAELRFAGDMV